MEHSHNCHLILGSCALPVGCLTVYQYWRTHCDIIKLNHVALQWLQRCSLKEARYKTTAAAEVASNSEAVPIQVSPILQSLVQSHAALIKSTARSATNAQPHTPPRTDSHRTEPSTARRNGTPLTRRSGSMRSIELSVTELPSR